MPDELTVPDAWERVAEENVDQWGRRDIGTLLLAAQAELSEAAEEAEAGLCGADDLEWVLRTIRITGNDVKQMHEDLSETDAREPVETPPECDVDPTAMDLDSLETKLEETAAVLIQLQATIEQLQEQ
jgi:phosphate uptake regulator